MKLLKSLAVTALVAAATLQGAKADTTRELPEVIQAFGTGSSMMMSGIANGEVDMLKDAADFFHSFSYNAHDKYSCNEREPGDLMAAVVQFNDKYCDIVRLNNFRVIQVDPLDVTRTVMPTVILVTKAIRGGGELEFSFEGSEDMAIGIAASLPNTLRYTLEYNGRPIPVETDGEGYFSSAVWDMGPSDEPFTLKISNPSDQTVSFTIAQEG